MMDTTEETKEQPEGTLEVGQLLDRKYRVDYQVGQGGMAAVWAGTNERTGKLVALKVLLPSLTAIPDLDGLFRREGLAASRVNHPNVVTVFDVIEHHGVPCIVMELLDGEPLDNYLARNGPLAVSDACSLLIPAMSGVAAAHMQGVIHRDLKPQNIFVCIGPDGRAVTTKVLDFGISVLIGLARDPATAPIERLQLGTPAYMAPEQITGGTSDERTDVYGFGVLFFETLTGQVPFPDENVPAVYRRILNDPAPPLGQFRSDLTAGLVKVIETALAKDPNHRHASLGAMITALEDELRCSALLPRVLTPVTGVPCMVGGTSEGTVATAGVMWPAGATGDHHETKLLAKVPLEANAAPRHMSDERSLEQLRPNAEAASAPTVIARRAPSHSLRGSWHLSRLVVWTGVGIALFIAGGIFEIWVNRDGPTPLVVSAEPLAPSVPMRIIVEPLADRAAPSTEVRPLQEIPDEVSTQRRTEPRQGARPARTQGARIRPAGKPAEGRDGEFRAGTLTIADF